MEPTFEAMSPAERIEYLQDLWDRLADEPQEVPVTDAQRAELRRRVTAYRADPTVGVPWEEVLERARDR
jgi:putative addiction module component (TIGR02574 family)